MIRFELTCESREAWWWVIRSNVRPKQKKFETNVVLFVPYV